jgi:hypothetical protein
MAVFTDLPDIVKGFSVRAIWQDRTVILAKTIPQKSDDTERFVVEVDVTGDENIKTLVVKPEGLSDFVVEFAGEEISLEAFDWSWKGRFKRMRKYLGHSYEMVANITGNKTTSIHRVVSSKEFPRNLRYAVQVWEEMHGYKLNKS